MIIGDGRLRGELEAQAKMLGLDEDVLFLGTRNDPEDFYPALDIVALTSLNEGTPLTLIEAMANARPVIATEVGGVVDSRVDHRNLVVGRHEHRSPWLRQQDRPGGRPGP